MKGKKNIAGYIIYFIPSNTGINKVRFYETKNVRKILIKELDGNNLSEDRLFSKAMREVNGNQDSRVPDFNAHYALSRTILTTVLISTVLLLISSYSSYWQSYLSIVVLLICWNRYKERAYYMQERYLMNI